MSIRRRASSTENSAARLKEEDDFKVRLLTSPWDQQHRDSTTLKHRRKSRQKAKGDSARIDEINSYCGRSDKPLVVVDLKNGHASVRKTPPTTPITKKRRDDSLSTVPSSEPDDNEETNLDKTNDREISPSWSDPDGIGDNNESGSECLSSASGDVETARDAVSPFLVSTIIEADAIEVQSVLVSLSLSSPRRRRKNKQGGENICSQRHGWHCRRVRFNTENIEYHESGRSLTAIEEWQDCWFTSEELRSFKLNQVEMVKQMFAIPPHASSAGGGPGSEPPRSTPEQQRTCEYSSRPPTCHGEDKPTKQSFRKIVVLRHKIKSMLRRTPSNPRRRNQPKRSVSLPDESSDGSFKISDDEEKQAPPPPEPQEQQQNQSLRRQQPDWREAMELLYQECRKVCDTHQNLRRRNSRSGVDTGEDVEPLPSFVFGDFDRSLFQKIYKDYGELVGLEVYILYALRGSVSAQIRRMLQFYRDYFYDSDDCHHYPRTRSSKKRGQGNGQPSRMYSYSMDEEEEEELVVEEKSTPRRFRTPKSNSYSVDEDDDTKTSRYQLRSTRSADARERPTTVKKPDIPLMEFVHNCRRFTLPGQFFVHEMALAQAAALQEEEEEQQRSADKEQNEENRLTRPSLEKKFSWPGTLYRPRV